MKKNRTCEILLMNSRECFPANKIKEISNNNQIYEKNVQKHV